jgi:ribosomal protein S18 acetylase RimI-like enzyme
VSALFARSYADAAEVRAFAPRGTRAEWQEYTASLVGSSGCGRFLPEASLVVDGPSGRPVAATVVSTIDRGVAHLAQVVVDPGARGRGLGERLVADASAAAVAAGCHTMTLLVAAGNRRARALYDRLGFVERAAFVVGLSAQPRRLSSVALATGGASTRR